MVFWHVNNQFLHPYLLFLFSTGSSLTSKDLVPYIMSLEGAQQRNAFNSIIEYCKQKNMSVYSVI